MPPRPKRRRDAWTPSRHPEKRADRRESRRGPLKARGLCYAPDRWLGDLASDLPRPWSWVQMGREDRATAELIREIGWMIDWSGGHATEDLVFARQRKTGYPHPAADCEGMGMTRLCGGLFGCGMISEFHLKGWRRIPEVEIVALGNRTIARAEARRAEFYPEARTYDRLESMLERERLDFVDILTVPWLHREHCLLARQAGVHIICQKPLCDTLEDGRALVRAMGGSQKLFAVHENHRYRPWFQRIRELHDAGTFGALRVVRLEQYDPSPPPELYKLGTERGLFLEYGTHLVDMVRALLGEPHRVYARMHRVTAGMRGESHALAVYEYPEATASINIAWQSAGPAFGGLLLEGERGVAYYEGTMARGAGSRFAVMQGKTVVVDEPRSPYEDYVESFYLLQRECVDCMLSGKPPTQSGAENLKTLASTEAAYVAAEQGRLVEVADYIQEGG